MQLSSFQINGNENVVKNISSNYYFLIIKKEIRNNAASAFINYLQYYFLSL